MSVEGRTKSRDSFAKKVGRKNYNDARKQDTDLSGLRIITYLERAEKEVEDLVKFSFNVHKEHIVHKGEDLGTDRIGYRSIHYVCDLGESRVKLPEYSRYVGLLFELQIRTVVQHAWAEIEHDRGYKFGISLPDALRRRLNLVSGLLELVDQEFSAIADAVDEYALSISVKTKSGDYSEPISATSVVEYLKVKSEQIEKYIVIEPLSRTASIETVVEELKDFGIDNLGDLDKILDEDFFDALKVHETSTTSMGLLRDAMMFRDLRKYLAQAWKEHWNHIEDNSIRFLASKYGRSEIFTCIEESGINEVER